MKRSKTRTEGAVVAMAMSVLLAPVTASAAIRGSFERTLQVSGPVDLHVQSGAGSIKVRTGAADTVSVLGDIHGSWRASEKSVRYLEEHPPIEQDGNVIRIGRIDDRDLTRGISISYELVVPVETALVSMTGSGSQDIGDLRGPVEVASGSGSLTIGRIGEAVEAKTGSGSVSLTSAKGRVRLRTGSGSIRARGVAGPITSSSGSGSVVLEQTGPGDVEVETGSGSIELHGVKGSLRAHSGSGSILAEGEMTGEWSLHASSGSVTVRLPADASFHLDARTSSGRIAADHPIASTEISKHHIRGDVRGGGPVLEIHTSSGNIRIK